MKRLKLIYINGNGHESDFFGSLKGTCATLSHFSMGSNKFRLTNLAREPSRDCTITGIARNGKSLLMGPRLPLACTFELFLHLIRAALPLPLSFFFSLILSSLCGERAPTLARIERETTGAAYFFLLFNFGESTNSSE